MKREEIILRAYAGKMSWIQAAEVLGMSCRHLLRLREKYKEWGFDGLHDGRIGKESPRRGLDGAIRYATMFFGVTLRT